jgi:DNA-binding response OmpR family regulator
MSLQFVLLVGRDPDKLNAMQAFLAEEAIIDCLALQSLPEASQSIPMYLPDLVLVQADELEAAGEDVSGFCGHLRDHFFEQRPVVVVQTSTMDPEQRIAYLVNGADDILTAQLVDEELRIRLLVHLRRNLDLLSHRISRLPGHDLFSKILQRRINRHNPWGLLMLQLNHFTVYQDVYGRQTAEQVLKTIGGLLGSIVLPPDFVGHLEDPLFAVVTHADQAEKVAQQLCKQFDRVVGHFYAENDQQQGYVITLSGDGIYRRVGFMSLSIGVTTAGYLTTDAYQAAVHKGLEMRNLARLQRSHKSHWTSERLRLSGGGPAPAFGQNHRPHLLVIEEDAALGYLLKTTFEMQNYEVDISCDLEEINDLLNAKRFDLVVLDSVLNQEAHSWELCGYIKAEYPDAAVVFMSTEHERERALKAGADFYFPKPFELISLLNWVDRYFKGEG